MLHCDQTVTLIHHSKDTDGDTYTCTVLDNASWYAKTVITTSGNGAQPSNTYEVRVMGNIDILPSPGDYVARGVVESIAKPSDLKGVEHFRITSVGDNRRGNLPHWRLSGS